MTNPLSRGSVVLILLLAIGAPAYAPPVVPKAPVGGGVRPGGARPVETPTAARPRAIVAPGYRAGIGISTGATARTTGVTVRPRTPLTADDVVAIGKVAAKLEAVRAAAADGSPEVVTQAVADVPVAALPPELHQAITAVPRGVRAVKTLDDLRAAVAAGDDAKSAALLRDVEVSDRPLAGDVRRWLGYRAMRDGKADAARAILGEAPPPDSRVLLRDLTRTLAAAETFGPDPGVVLLVPEAPATGIRPGVKEDPLADLPPLTEVSAVEKRCQDGLSSRIASHLQTHQARGNANLGRVQGFVEAAREREKDPAFEDERRKEREALAAVEAKLGRPLDPAERLLAQAVLRQGKTPDEVAKIVKDVENVPANRGERK